MDSEQFNGWVNRETWAAHLHLSNSVDSQAWIAILLADYRAEAPYSEAVTDGSLTIEQAIRYAIADSIQGAFETWADEMIDNPDGVDRDRRAELHDIGSLWRVDWLAVAAALIEEGDTNG